MTYGFCPQNWRAFEAELQERGIAIADIEKARCGQKANLTEWSASR